LSTYLKPVLVLFISIGLFAGFSYLADNGLLEYVQARFYNPSIVNSFVKENQKDAELVQNHINELQNRFAATLNEPAVRSSFLYNQSAADIFERSRIYGILLETTGGLQSVQFIDSNGIRIHYSTSARDIVSQNRESTAYRNYTEDSRALPYDSVSIAAYGNSKFTMDDTYDRIIFSYPFYDSMDVYRGTALFSLSVRALAEKLIAEGRLKANDDVSIIKLPPGIVYGSPDTSKANILDKVSSVWSNGYQDHVILDAEESGVKLALITTKTKQNLFFGRLVNNSIFSIPESMLFILKLSIFLTFYLTIFFFINLRPNPATLVKSRIKKLRSNLFEQLYINKSSQDRAKWILELEQRREEIRIELKHNLIMRRSAEKKTDLIIDNAWDELLAVIKSGSGSDIVDLNIRDDKPLEAKAKTEDVDHVEDIDEVEEIEEIEEIEEASADADIEEVEGFKEVDDLDWDEANKDDEEADLEEIEEIDEIEEISDFEEAAAGIDTEIDIDEVSAEVDIEETPIEVDIIEEKPVHFDTSRGLLKLASEIEQAEEASASAVADEEPAHFDTSKGLLKLASEIEEAADSSIEADTVAEEPALFGTSRGLLKLASEIEKTDEIVITDAEAAAAEAALAAEEASIEASTDADVEELEAIETPAAAAPAKGLLALASKASYDAASYDTNDDEDEYEKNETTSYPVRGLLALAREIEFGSEHPVKVVEEDLNAEIDVVSPFSSMFSSLDDADASEVDFNSEENAN